MRNRVILCKQIEWRTWKSRGVLSFRRGKWPVSGSGQSQKGQPGPGIRVYEECIRGRRDQGSLLLK